MKLIIQVVATVDMSPMLFIGKACFCFIDCIGNFSAYVKALLRVLTFRDKSAAISECVV